MWSSHIKLLLGVVSKSHICTLQAYCKATRSWYATGLYTLYNRDTNNQIRITGKLRGTELPPQLKRLPLMYWYLVALFIILGHQKSVTTSPRNDCIRGCDGIFRINSYPYLVQCPEDVVWKLKLRYGTVALFTTKTCTIAISFDAMHTEAKAARFFNI